MIAKRGFVENELVCMAEVPAGVVLDSVGVERIRIAYGLLGRTLTEEETWDLIETGVIVVDVVDAPDSELTIDIGECGEWDAWM